MEPGDFAHINRIICQSGPQWLGEAYLAHYDRLIAATEALRQSGDDFTIPDRRSQGCWQELWPIYDRLRRRHQAAEEVSAPDRAWYAANRAETDRTWQRYIEELPLLRREIKRSSVSEKDCLAFLKLTDDDFLDPVDPDAPGGKRAYWHVRADRIAGALGRWNTMTPEQRTMIPTMLAGVRSQQSAAQLEYLIDKFLPMVADEFNKLERRVADLELGAKATQGGVQ